MANGKGKGLSESCNAKLHINGQFYEGSTGKDHGHAEMDALHNFIMLDPGNKNTVKGSVEYCAKLICKEDVQKSVFCPSRPCCLKCSEVLKTLGFNCGAGTEWSQTTMGSTEWGASQNVRSLLEQCGIDYEKIKEMK